MIVVQFSILYTSLKSDLYGQSQFTIRFYKKNYNKSIINVILYVLNWNISQYLLYLFINKILTWLNTIVTEFFKLISKNKFFITYYYYFIFLVCDGLLL